ncbi:hypothetical protein F5Y16DRAFT_402319 [Xylariaceae sp. FL0255]|nr:hypothetical protein F5Y16DRAFT_402319 [Xylariaceae sp. FL0255]
MASLEVSTQSMLLVLLLASAVALSVLVLTILLISYLFRAHHQHPLPSVFIPVDSTIREADDEMQHSISVSDRQHTQPSATITLDTIARQADRDEMNHRIIIPSRRWGSENGLFHDRILGYNEERDTCPIIERDETHRIRARTAQIRRRQARTSETSWLDSDSSSSEEYSFRTGVSFSDDDSSSS